MRKPKKTLKEIVKTAIDYLKHQGVGRVKNPEWYIPERKKYEKKCFTPRGSRLIHYQKWLENVDKNRATIRLEKAKQMEDELLEMCKRHSEMELSPEKLELGIEIDRKCWKFGRYKAV